MIALFSTTTVIAVRLSHDIVSLLYTPTKPMSRNARAYCCQVQLIAVSLDYLRVVRTTLFTLKSILSLLIVTAIEIPYLHRCALQISM